MKGTMKILTSRGLAWRLYLSGFVRLIVPGAALPAVGWALRLERRQAPPLSTSPAPMIRDPWFDNEGRMPPRPPSPVAPLLGFFLSGLGIVGVGSFLTARWIVRPSRRCRARRAP